MDAKNEYDTAISKNKDYGEAYYRRGQNKNRLGQVEEALEDFTEAISLRPDYFDAYFERALVLQELQEYPSALDNYDRAIEINPNDIYAYFYRAETELLLLLVDDARQDLEAALELAKQQENEEMIAEISSLLQGIFGHNTSEEEDE